MRGARTRHPVPESRPDLRPPNLGGCPEISFALGWPSQLALARHPAPPCCGGASSVPAVHAIETPRSFASDSTSSGSPGALAWWVATAAGVGYFPVASGTAGSAAGVLLFFALGRLALPVYVLTVVALTALGVWAADRCESAFGEKDDGRIVIDEVVGQLITLAPLLVLHPPHVFSWTVTGFVLFRVFDVWKPGPARWLERNLPGGLGVVMDDVMAGIFAALALAAGVMLFAGAA